MQCGVGLALLAACSAPVQEAQPSVVALPSEVFEAAAKLVLGRRLQRLTAALPKQP